MVNTATPWLENPLAVLGENRYFKYAYSPMRICTDTRTVTEVGIEWVQEATKHFRLVVFAARQPRRSSMRRYDHANSQWI
jgi:hypothetical protein